MDYWALKIFGTSLGIFIVSVLIVLLFIEPILPDPNTKKEDGTYDNRLFTTSGWILVIELIVLSIGSAVIYRCYDDS
jgi:quinol-cytochrome oxidoreductase complex cytochrome b subunit